MPYLNFLLLPAPTLYSKWYAPHCTVTSFLKSIGSHLWVNTEIEAVLNLFLSLHDLPSWFLDLSFNSSTHSFLLPHWLCSICLTQGLHTWSSCQRIHFSRAVSWLSPSLSGFRSITLATSKLANLQNFASLRLGLLIKKKKGMIIPSWEAPLFTRNSQKILTFDYFQRHLLWEDSNTLLNDTVVSVSWDVSKLSSETEFSVPIMQAETASWHFSWDFSIEQEEKLGV